MSNVLTVEIGGQRYPIRSALDEKYVTELAAYVDQKMRAASDAPPASDMLGLTEGELAYRANATVFEAGADLWDILGIMPRDE